MIQAIAAQTRPAAAGVRYAVGESATRPWGTWEVLATGEGYTLKRIVVNPGQRLSLQYHRFRSEHWTVVQGVAEAQINGRVSALTAGESVYVHLGAHHRLKNISDTPLVMIEVQTGACLDESDIIRLEDDYARV
jgi:mannose-6-phosphate isomerase